MLRKFIAILFFSLLMIATKSVFATTFYVDAHNGSDNNNGSYNSPWQTMDFVLANKVETYTFNTAEYTSGTSLVLQNAGAPVKEGDRIILKAGYYGQLFIKHLYNETAITIESEEGAYVQFDSIRVRSSLRWILRGLKVSPSSVFKIPNHPLVLIEGSHVNAPSAGIYLHRCEVFSQSNTSNWSKYDWDTKALDGVMLRNSYYVIVESNYIHDVNFAFQVLSTEKVWGMSNLIERFSGDGIRITSDDGLYEGNYIHTPLNVNDNHDDGIQLWSVGSDGKSGTGLLSNVTIRGNKIEHRRQQNDPFYGNFQAIGGFDGMFQSILVENNMISVDSYHGISFRGLIGSHILNNTIVSYNNNAVMIPLIKVYPHKDGRESSQVLIRNNLSTGFDLKNGVYGDSNIQVDDLFAHFSNPASHNLALSPSSSAINSGNPELSPTADIFGTSRTLNGSIDVGAFEYNSNQINGSSASNAFTPEGLGFNGGRDERSNLNDGESSDRDENNQNIDFDSIKNSGRNDDISAFRIDIVDSEDEKDTEVYVRGGCSGVSQKTSLENFSFFFLGFILYSFLRKRKISNSLL